MIPIEIIAAGNIKKSSLLDIWEDYIRRISTSVTLYEIEETHKNKFEQKMLQKVKSGAIIIALDERGKALSSMEIAKKFENYAIESRKPIQIFIGAADGLPSSIKEKADMLLAFGKQTWPHKLIRIMLIEQIYRAEKIIEGHPYHREG